MVQIKFKLNLRLGRKFVEEMKLKTDLETQDPQAIGMFCKKKKILVHGIPLNKVVSTWMDVRVLGWYKYR